MGSDRRILIEMAEDEVEITQEQAEELREQLGYPTPEPKFNTHTFLHKVATSKDTTKTGNLSVDELGIPELPVRSTKELELFSRKVMENDFLADYFKVQAENTLATSLSKDAKLIDLAIAQRRVIEDATKHRKTNPGWFGQKGRKKDEGEKDEE